MIYTFMESLVITLSVVIGVVVIVSVICLSVLAGTTTRQVLPGRQARRLRKAQTDLAIKDMARQIRQRDLEMAGLDREIARVDMERLALTSGNSAHPELQETPSTQ